MEKIKKNINKMLISPLLAVLLVAGLLGAVSAFAAVSNPPPEPDSTGTWYVNTNDDLHYAMANALPGQIVRATDIPLVDDTPVVNGTPSIIHVKAGITLYFYSTQPKFITEIKSSLGGSHNVITIDKGGVLIVDSIISITGNSIYNYGEGYIDAGKVEGRKFAGGGSVTYYTVLISYRPGVDDGSVTMINPQQQTWNVSVGRSITENLLSAVPTRTGYIFAGWLGTALNSDGTMNHTTDQMYQPGDPITIDTSLYTTVVMVALWSAPYTVTYEPGDYGKFTAKRFTDLAYGAPTPEFTGSTESKEPGWHFTGWEPELSATVTGDATYVAQWSQEKPVTYTITYDPGLHGTFAPEIVSDLVSGALTPAFTGSTEDCEPGWYFTGWSPALSALVTSNATYVAQWSPFYTVTYTSDGADPATSTPPQDRNKYRSGYLTTALGPKDNGGNLAQAGFVLTAWYGNDGNTYKIGQEFAVTGNITLSPVWTPEQEGNLSVTKTIDAAQATEVNVGDSVIYTITVTNDGDTSAADVVVREGLTGDWGVPKLTTADPSRVIEYSISDDNLLTVTSLVYDEAFTVTYTVIAQPADAGRTLTNSVTLTYTYNNGNGPADGGAAAQNDEVTVAPLYTVTYTNNGADQTTSKPPQDDNKYIKGTAATVLGPKDHGGNLARAGFVLTKWIDDKGKTYEFGQEFAVTGNITLRPVWTPEQVGDLSVTKTTDAAQAREVNVGDSVVYTITVTNDGETNATNLVLGESMTGVWGVPKLTTADPARTIDYAISDNNLLTVDNLASGDSFTVTYTVTAQPADAGKILTNTVTLTYTYNNGNGPVEGSDDAQNDIVTVVPYTVTYTNDGADSATNTPPRDDNKYQYGEAATVLGPKDNGGNLAQAGYVLIKWIDGKGNTYEFDQEFAITGNITLSPVWTPEQTGILSVTKMTDAAQATEVNVGDSVVYTITVTNDGETSATDIAVSESMTGAWGVPELTTADPARRIEYSISGDNLLTVDNLASGDSFTVTYTVTAQPADAGKILTNTVTLTYTYNNGNGPVEGSAAAQNDIVTVAPQAQTNTYMVTYNGNGSTGGTVVSDTSSPYQPGAAVTVLGNTGSLTKPNYKFAGWNTKADGTGISYAPGDTFGMPANDVTLYAQWTLTGGGGGSGSSTPSKPSTGGDAKAVSIPATTDTGTNTGTPPAVLNSTDHIAYILGYPDGKIHPGANITRAEVATIFFRLFTDDSRKANWATSNSYGDVSSSKWYNNAVSTLSTARILKGYPDGTFHPNASITRAEFAAMAARFASGSPATAITFSDLNGNWATDEIYRAAGLGWITGYPDGTFRPNQNITRAEAMSIVNRVLNRRVISADDLRSDMTVWSDSSNVTAWYYFDVQEATNSHTYQRKADGVSEQWTAIVANPDWSAMQQPGYQP